MIIKGREYGLGIHVIDGYRVHVIDASTYRTLGKAEEQKAEEQVPVIDINTADADTLESIDGVGSKAARRIVEGRPFDSVDDLERIKGVSKNTIKNNRARITV